MLYSPFNRILPLSNLLDFRILPVGVPHRHDTPQLLQNFLVAHLLLPLFGRRPRHLGPSLVLVPVEQRDRRGAVRVGVGGVRRSGVGRTQTVGGTGVRGRRRDLFDRFSVLEGEKFNLLFASDSLNSTHNTFGTFGSAGDGRWRGLVLDF